MRSYILIVANFLLLVLLTMQAICWRCLCNVEKPADCWQWLAEGR